jgi:hypothetical protein
VPGSLVQISTPATIHRETVIVMPAQRKSHDDLTRITGIGAQLHAKLTRAGIRTFTQLGQASVEKLAAASGLSTKRIEDMDWLGQARALAPGQHPPTASEEDLRPPDRHNFTVELQLDATSGAVLSTKVHHVQSGDEDSWRGWSGDRVVSFIEPQAGMTSPIAEETMASHHPPVRAAEPEDRRHQPSVVAFTQVRATRLWSPGSGSTIATLTLDLTELETYLISPTALIVEVYGQRPPFSKTRLLGRVRAALQAQRAVSLDIDLLDPASESLLELFAVLTFLDGSDGVDGPVSFELARAKLTLKSSAAEHQDSRSGTS